MRKKMFLILCSTLSMVFLISWFLIYIIFRSVLYREIEQQQKNLQAYNETIFTSYIDSFGMVPFQLVNDEEIGASLNLDSDNSLVRFKREPLLCLWSTLSRIRRYLLEVRIGLSVIYQWFIRLYGKKKKIFFVRCRLQTRWSESLE